MFNELTDDTLDLNGNWAIMNAAGGRPTQYKFGLNYVERSRDFQSRRFHFIPITTQKADTGNLQFDNRLPPEQIFVSSNIGTAFRFNEETRPTDAYAGDQTTMSGYGMIDIAMAARTRLVAGARVEKFDQTVITQDPFGLFASEVQAENNNTDLFPAVNFVQGVGANSNIRLSYSTTVNRPEFRELAEFEFTDVVGNRAVKGNADLKRALIQNVDGRWEMFGGGRSIVAASVFYKYFNDPIERVVIAAANPIVTFQNADKARNFGIELEAGHQVGQYFFLNANYTWVDSQITLNPEQLGVQTSSERALAGQSKNLFNAAAEYTLKGFSTRLLFNYFGDRIADVGANGAPDIVEQGRGSLDLVFSQRVRGFSLRLNVENLTDSDYLFTQTLTEERDAEALPARANRDGVVRLQRLLSAAMTNTRSRDGIMKVSRIALALAAAAVLALIRAATMSADQAPPVNVPGIDKPVIVVTGDVGTSTRRGPATNYYVLRGAVFVRSGSTLNIAAGTRVIGESGSVGTLIVERGGRLNAIGTADAPIVFTSDQPIGAAWPRRLGRPHHQWPCTDSTSKAARPLARATLASTEALIDE